MLDSISPTFCLAKWLNLTLHLERGTGHSCHHPQPEPIPLENLAGNPSSLHNSPQKILQRASMLRGEKPEACSYCWKLEDLGSEEVVSDRIFKSNQWRDIDVEKLLKTSDAHVLPKYVEVSFSNRCNLKCSYCSSRYSTAWSKENSIYGNMPHTLAAPVGFSSEMENPYIEAFWEWWPQLRNDLEILRITGGEPLLSESFWKILDDLFLNFDRKISLVINSNLMVGESTIKKLAARIGSLLLSGKLSKVKVVTSLECDGIAAEYSRYGLKVETFWKNVDLLLEMVPDLEITITNTMQVLAVTSYIDFLKKVLIRRRGVNSPRVVTDPSFLKEPAFLSMEFMPTRIKLRFAEDLELFFLSQKKQWSSYEEIKIKNLIVFLRKTVGNEDVEDARIKVIDYFKEYDKRRRLSFSDVFPELWEYSQ